MIGSNIANTAQVRCTRFGRSRVKGTTALLLGHAKEHCTRIGRSRVKEMQMSSENGNHRHIIKTQLRAQIVTGEADDFFVLKFDLCAWTGEAAMSFQGY